MKLQPIQDKKRRYRIDPNFKNYRGSAFYHDITINYSQRRGRDASHNLYLGCRIVRNKR